MNRTLALAALAFAAAGPVGCASVDPVFPFAAPSQDVKPVPPVPAPAKADDDDKKKDDDKKDDKDKKDEGPPKTLFEWKVGREPEKKDAPKPEKIATDRPDFT